MLCEKDLVDITATLATPIIALIVVFIAYQQWKTNDRRLKHEMFDRRYRVFEAAQNFIITALRDLTIEQKDLKVFYAEKLGAGFIFDADVEKYLNTMFEKATQLRGASRQD